jgi:hypothetical protein
MSFYRTPTSIHPSSPIKLSSPKLLSSAANIKRFDQEQAAATEEYSALASLERSDIGPTVTRYERPVTKSTIDLTDRRPVPGKRETPGAVDEAARHKADVARLLNGEELEEIPDLRARKSKVARKAAAIQTAKELEQQAFQAEFLIVAAEYSKKIRPEIDKKTRRVMELLGEAFAICADLAKTKQDLVDSSMPTAGFEINLDFMRSEEVRSMFHDAKAAGFVNAIPETLRG